MTRRSELFTCLIGLLGTGALTLACGDAGAGGSEATTAGGETTTAGEAGSDAGGSESDSEGETAGPGVDESGEWPTRDPELLGLDPVALEALRAYAMAPEMNTQAVLVIREGAIAAEWYAPDRDPDDWATSWSMAKSFSSTLIGVALHEGLLESLDVPMTDFIPEWIGSDREGITLRHVLSMSAGFDWGESEDNYVDLLEMGVSADQLAHALAQEVAHPPGEVWSYSSGTTMLLSRVIEVVTGMQAEAYARAKLAEPLGFKRYEWWIDGVGSTLTYCCIDATSRDFARFGQLYLQRGAWGDQQLFDPSWADAVASAHQPDNPSYGLQFWLNKEGGTPDRPKIPRALYHAQGYDHQFVFIFPEHDMLLVRNARFIRPEGPPVASEGLDEAGMGLGGLAQTGSFAPDESWDDTTFLELLMAAVVE